MKKILFLLSSLKIGGAERQTIDLLNNLDDELFKSYICYLERKESLKKKLNVHKCAGIYCLEKKNRFDMFLLWRLRVIVKKINPDIIFCVDPYTAFIVNFSTGWLSNQYSLIQVLHSTLSKNRYNDIIIRLIYKHSIQRSCNVVFVSKNQQQHWQRHYDLNSGNSKVIYNGVDLKEFSISYSDKLKTNLRKDIGLKNNHFVIGICAAMRPEKRHEDLIGALKIIRSKGIPGKVLLIGDGPEKQNLVKHVNRMSLEGHVVFAGFQVDVRPFLAVCDVMVICSDSVETFSMAVLEAMAMAKPVVASDIGGASEQIEPSENGFLFSPRDVDSLASYLEHLFTSDNAQEIAKKAKQKVQGEFTLEKMVKQYQDLFLTV